MEFIEDGLIPIIAILSAVALPIGFSIYLALALIRARHKENMEMIKQGLAPSSKQTVPSRYRSLRNGILCVGTGLGLAVGVLLSTYVFCEIQSRFLVMGSCVLLFLGAAYVIFFMMTKDKNMEE